MAKRIKTKIGDIFSIAINEKEKRYMQLIAYDRLQLNSDVIRCFEKKYSISDNPKLDEILENEVLFYAHCATDFGLKLNIWTIVGNSLIIGKPEEIIFRSTDDYARKEGDRPVKTSTKWYVWKLTDQEFTRIGKMSDNGTNTFIGLVLNPMGILELAKGNEYPPNYPS